jgi:alkanesulfonate monooxygenase SsuD/methylene tetrahydromethanopterin reductase-like flavin-dependent oxidoreductase (luciferase family)
MGIETLAAASVLEPHSLAGRLGYGGERRPPRPMRRRPTYQAAVAKNNQILAGRYADLSTERGNIQSELSNYKTRQALGTARAGFAAQGVDVNSGSPLAVRQSIAEVGELDSQIIRQKAAEEAFGYKVKGGDFAAEAELDKMKASNAETAGAFNVASSILGTASSVSGKWAGYQNKGTFA